jgi:protease-4
MSTPSTPGRTGGTQYGPQTIVVRQEASRGWLVRLLFFALMLSLIGNVAMFAKYREYFRSDAKPTERFRSGDKGAQAKIAAIEISGTLMPPFTGRILKAVKAAERDDDVKGVLLVVDSPGGLVADSNQVYHELSKLRQKKPIAVVMKRIAASGGYYVSMAAGEEGRIFAEPTTWTGSIGVIIPRFNAQELSEKIGVQAEPLATGPFKDSLSPFRELTAEERAVWVEIMNESFAQFVDIIAENRKALDQDGVKKLATGQVYTAQQAKANGLIDEIGYEEDAIASLKDRLGLKTARVVDYEHEFGVVDLLAGSAEANRPETRWRSLLEMTVPQAMYYCSWAPGIPAR